MKSAALQRSRYVAWSMLLIAPLLFALGSTPTHAKPLIEALESRLDGDRLLVSFNVADGMKPETLERIHSGIAVSYKHRIDIVRKRWLPLWPAKDMARTRVVTEATYDSLTRQYTLLRRLEVKARRKRDAVEPEELRRTTDSLEEMTRWMTQLREIPVYDPSRNLDLKGLRLRVESSLGRKFVLLIFPSTVDAYAERRLEP